MREEIFQSMVELQQAAEQTEQNIAFVQEQISDLQEFLQALDALKKSKEKEMLAPLGRGVYLKATRADDEKLFVEVGAGVVVRKTPDEAKEVIRSQLRKLREAKIQLNIQLENIIGRLQELMQIIENE
ncbi:prefoldin subunit alpha [Candidatus Pacearchaeota archaeon]|nr:MAG: prefoldin subunit alpha [Candidatus Pacearchaeota archaeon]